MSTSSIENLQEEFFNSIPLPVLVMNDQLGVIDANVTARYFFDQNVGFQLGRLCGELIRCFYNLQASAPCGQTAYCSDCIIRKSVDEVFSKNLVVRKKSSFLIQKVDLVEEISFLLTVWPFMLDDLKLAGVMMEDLRELFQLGKILPICAACKKIKVGENVWEKVENYINKHLGPDFSHGICPECRSKIYPELNELL
jgi:hypothetical protein